MRTEIQLQTVNFRQQIRTLRRNQPQATETMLIHALVLFLTDQPVEAVTQLTALLKMDPDNQQAQKLRLRVKILQKLEASAASLYQSGRWNDAAAKWGEVLQVFQFSQYP
jgi:DnaJ family protein C protein 7